MGIFPYYRKLSGETIFFSGTLFAYISPDQTTRDMIQTNGQTKVIDWYKEKFHTDDWAIENLNKGITFFDVYNCLYLKGDVYALLGASDSIVRERVFDELATLMDCSYDIIYFQWLKAEMPHGSTLYYDMTKLHF